MSERQGHASRMLPLVALVRRQVAASGLPLRGFAKERGIKYGTLQRYHNKKLEPLLQGLKPDTLKDLAAALDVPLSEVERAADASVGRRYKQNVGPNISIYVADFKAMSPEDQAVLMDELHRVLTEREPP